MSDFDDDLEDGECPGCGSTEDDRIDYAKRNTLPGERPISTELIECIFCHKDKCCMCDMGRDVSCNICDSEDEDEDPDAPEGTDLDGEDEDSVEEDDETIEEIDDDE